MAGRDSGKAVRPSRRVGLGVEALDRRELMAAGGIAQSLGPFVGPGQGGPRVAKPAKVVNAHDSVQTILAATLGPGLDRVQSRGEAAGQTSAAVLKKAVLNQPFVHAVLSDGDTYQLFQAPALAALVGSQQVSGTTATTPATTPTTTTTGTTTPTPAVQTVSFSIPAQATIQSMNGDTSVIQVNPSGSVAGFSPPCRPRTFAFSTRDRRSWGRWSFRVPPSRPVFPRPRPRSCPMARSRRPMRRRPLCSKTSSAAGVAGVAPNAPNSVPGLRLAPLLRRTKVFPTGVARRDLLKAFRLAVQRDVFTLDATQTTQVSDGLNQFFQQVQSLVATGDFTPAVPIAPPSLPSKTLGGTLASRSAWSGVWSMSTRAWRAWSRPTWRTSPAGSTSAMCSIARAITGSRRRFGVP